MAKSSTERMRELKERERYCMEDSQININIGFAIRCAKKLKGTIEGEQLENLITKQRERIKSKQYETTFDRPFIS